MEHVEDLAGRLMYRRHYSFVLICSVTLEDGHDLKGESCIQTRGRLLKNRILCFLMQCTSLVALLHPCCEVINVKMSLQLMEMVVLS